MHGRKTDQLVLSTASLQRPAKRRVNGRAGRFKNFEVEWLIKRISLLICGLYGFMLEKIKTVEEVMYENNVFG